MVHLGDDGLTAAGQPLGHHHLPQRPVEFEWPTHHVGDEVVEFTAAARPRETHPPEVVVQLELGIVHPHGVVQSERHPDGALAELGNEMKPLFDGPADLGVAGGG